MSATHSNSTHHRAVGSYLTSSLNGIQMPQLNCTSCQYCGDLPLASVIKGKNFCPNCHSPLKRVIDVNGYIALAVYLLAMIEFTRVDPNSPWMFWPLGGVGLLAVARFQKYANNVIIRE